MTAQGSQVPEQQQNMSAKDYYDWSSNPWGEQPAEDVHSKEEPSASTAYDSEVPGQQQTWSANAYAGGGEHWYWSASNVQYSDQDAAAQEMPASTAESSQVTEQQNWSGPARHW